MMGADKSSKGTGVCLCVDYGGGRHYNNYDMKVDRLTDNAVLLPVMAAGGLSC